MKISSTLKSKNLCQKTQGVAIFCHGFFSANQVGLGSPLPLPDADTDLSQEFNQPWKTNSNWIFLFQRRESPFFTQWWTMEVLIIGSLIGSKCSAPLVSCKIIEHLVAERMSVASPVDTVLFFRRSESRSFPSRRPCRALWRQAWKMKSSPAQCSFRWMMLDVTFE